MNWLDLGEDDGGLPVHMPIGVTDDGHGPTSDADAHHYVCWCGDSECLLTRELRHAWEAGTRSVVSADDLLTEQDLTRAPYRLNLGTLRNWRHRGEGPAYIKVGALVRYRRGDVAAWIESRTLRTGAP